MGADTDSGKGEEIARITPEENADELVKLCIPQGLAPLLPGDAWVMKHGGSIRGHIEENGDFIIDSHTP